MTVLFVIVSVVGAISVATVVAMFLWAAREDGRGQERLEALLRRSRY